MADDLESVLKRLDERTRRFIEDDLAAGRPVANIGTFRIVDDEGHIEIINPDGSPPNTPTEAGKEAEARAKAELESMLVDDDE